MGTSNFHTANAQATYVVDYGDDECMWLEAQEYLGDWIKELDTSFELDDSIQSEQELRSFPTSSIGYWENGITFLGLTFDFRVNLFLRSGYYEAACLDYEVEWFIEGDHWEDISSILQDIESDPATYNIKPGLWEIHKIRLEEHLLAIQDNLTNHVESILPQVSTPYGVAAQFSNGETIYKEL